MEAAKVGALTILGLVVAAVGVITPIIWDLYKTSSALEVQMIGVDKLVEPSQKVERLEIRYAGEVIPSVSRLTLLIVNTGRTPIQEKDHVEPFSLTLPQNTRLLEFSVEETSRRGAKVGSEVANGRVVLRLPLLNAKDYVRVSMLTGGSPLPLSVGAGIVGVSDVPLVDLTREFEGGRRKIPGSVTFIAWFSAFLLAGALLGGLPELRRAYRAQAALKSGQFRVPALTQRDDYLRYAEKELDFLPAAARVALKDYLGKLAGTVDDAARGEIDRFVREAVERSRPKIAPFVIVVTLAAIGFAYVLVNLL